jgi:hypothetical protein
MHRHHISYKLNITVPVPSIYHWLIHVPGSLGLATTAWWTGQTGRGCVYWQNKRARQIGGDLGRLILGYPNPLQIALNFIAWVVWGYGWAFLAGLAIFLNR